jgi:hypothetical protein
MLPCMKDVMSIDYKVHVIKQAPAPAPNGKLPKQHWFVIPRCPSTAEAHHSWHLIITTVGTNRWHTYGCDFDVYMLSYNKTSLYVRLSYDVFDQHPEVQHKGQLAHLLSRIKQRRFCLLPTQTGELDPEALIKAYKLVSNGWTMDDMLMPGLSWLVYMIQPTSTSTSTSTPPHQECAICKEDFQVGDIAIQLQCSHVFHVHCAPGQSTTGLHAWVHLHKKTTCPMCRAPLSWS